MRWMFVLAIVSAGCGSGGGGEPALDANGGGDDATVDLDAAVDVDAAVGVDAAIDAAVATEPVACGDTFCRADQTCVDGACVFECPAGAAHVPGDYATAQEAFTALERVGGVICLGPLVEVAPQFGGFWLYPTASLTVIGSGPDATRLVGELDINDAWDGQRTTPIRLAMRGLAVESGLEILTHRPFHDEIVIENVRVRGHVRNGDDLSLGVNHNGGTTVVLDGVDVSAGATGIAFEVWPSSLSDAPHAPVILRNSWLHDSESAVLLADDYGGEVRLVNNTFARGYAGIWGRGTTGLTYANNVFDSFMVAQGAFLSAGVRHHNAYRASGTMYTPLGETDVACDSADLSTAMTPMSPTAGSRLRGAADASMAPATDYWGNPRGTSPDIGAVEGW